MEAPFANDLAVTQGVATTAVLVGAVRTLSLRERAVEAKEPRSPRSTDSGVSVPSQENSAEFGQPTPSVTTCSTLPVEQLRLVKSTRNWRSSAAEIAVVAISLLVVWCMVAAVSVFYAFPQVRMKLEIRCSTVALEARYGLLSYRLCYGSMRGYM